MNFKSFKDAINIFQDDDRAQVYVEQELGNDVFLQTAVTCVRKEIDGNGTTYIIVGTRATEP